MDRANVEAWLQKYVTAWSSNDPQDIGNLFTDNAGYYTAPFREPWSGREAIVSGWIDRKDEPGEWTYRSEILAFADDLVFVRGWTTYREGPNYSNLWIIRLEPDGRCSEFTEWWMAES